MIKIGIISLYGNDNYGNRLQNYGVQEFFRSLGCETVLIKNPYKYRMALPHKFPKYQIKNTLHYINHLKRFLGKGDNKPETEREKSFKAFAKAHIKETEGAIDRYNAKKAIPKCDYYVLGSDQVWNWKMAPVDDKVYSLAFAPKEKRLSFAASFGMNRLPEEVAPYMKKNVSGFRLITVREKSAVELVKELTGREAHLIADPTVFIPPSHWEKIEKKPDNIPEKYILCYLLGPLSDYDTEMINGYAKERGMPLVMLNFETHNGLFSYGPDAFVYLVHHAERVITDSFHACVFSILFKRKFSVVYGNTKKGMLNRVETLLELFELPQSIISNTQLEGADFNYDKNEQIITSQREKAAALFKAVFKEDNLL